MPRNANRTLTLRSLSRATDFGNAGRPGRFRRQHIQVNGQPYTIIGIAPDGFSGANALVAPDMWVPLGVRAQLGSAFGDSETMHDLNNPKNLLFNLTARTASRLDDRDSEVALAGLGPAIERDSAGRCEGARELQIQNPSRFS